MSFMDWKSTQGGKGKGKGPDTGAKYSSNNVDRISQVGSIRSNMSLTAADKKLESLQAEVARLSTITKQQADTIDRLQRIVSQLQRKK